MMASILRKSLAMIAVIGVVGLAAMGCTQYDSYPTEIPLGAYHAEAPPPSVTGPATANPLLDNAVPQHPFLALNGNSGTHADAYSSGTYSTAGPLGINPVVQSAIPVDFWRNQQLLALAGECLSQTFNESGTVLYSVCADVAVFKLIAMDVTDHFNRLGVLTMPERANVGEPLTEQKSDSSGGLYFHLIKDGDGNNQVLTANGDEHIQVIATSGEPDPGTGADYGFTIVEDYDVKSSLFDPDPGSPDASKITDVMIDWNNASLIWFISKDGTVGILDRSDGSVETAQLTHLDGAEVVNEETQNSVAIDNNGLLVVSNYAMYHLSVGTDNAPVVDWRTEYDRGGSTSGTFSEGSGTTPTALGPDYVAITDFADPIKVVVYSRAAGDVVCSQGVFEEGSSSTENSLIGYYDPITETGSIIVENNFGYEIPIDPLDQIPVGLPDPGITRIDVTGGASDGECTEVWTSDEISPSAILKLSTGNGLVYIYTPKYMDPNSSGGTTMNEIAWYFTALDFETGATEFQILTSTGKEWNVNYAAISVAPDGTAYVGTLRGLLSVKDGSP
jgi:hypothetical protein